MSCRSARSRNPSGEGKGEGTLTLQPPCLMLSPGQREIIILRDIERWTAVGKL